MSAPLKILIADDHPIFRRGLCEVIQADAGLRLVFRICSCAAVPRPKPLRREKPGLDSLTPTERRILKFIAEDKTSKEIAAVLSCAVRTVETHRQNISQKLELSWSHSLLKFAYDNKSLL